MLLTWLLPGISLVWYRRLMLGACKIKDRPKEGQHIQPKKPYKKYYLVLEYTSNENMSNMSKKGRTNFTLPIFANICEFEK